MDDKLYDLVHRHVSLSDDIGFFRQESELSKALYNVSKHLLPPECIEREPNTATELVRVERHRAYMHEYMCEPFMWPPDAKLNLGEPETENILKDIGGINMDGKGFVTPDNIEKVIVRTKDGREFEGCVKRSEYMPGPLGRQGYSELTICTLKQTSKDHYGIKDVIFNNPATIVKWDDGSQTVVYCQDNVKDTTKVVDGKEVKVRKPMAADSFNPEIGLAMAIVKKYFGNMGNYNNVFRKYLPEFRKEKSGEKTREKAEE